MKPELAASIRGSTIERTGELVGEGRGEAHLYSFYFSGQRQSSCFQNEDQTRKSPLVEEKRTGKQTKKKETDL
jgi:hypothetical protein